ncbi:unnamed protein product [Sphagnum balticum]
MTSHAESRAGDGIGNLRVSVPVSNNRHNAGQTLRDSLLLRKEGGCTVVVVSLAHSIIPSPSLPSHPSSSVLPARCMPYALLPLLHIFFTFPRSIPVSVALSLCASVYVVAI